MLAIRATPEQELSIQGLAQQLMLKPNGAVQMVDRLEALGMMSRSASSEDRRQVLVRLTPEGARVLQTLAVLHMRELVAHRKLLTDSLQRLKRLEAK
jgi:DNA-binding MarR family transcriptional regulator